MSPCGPPVCLFSFALISESFDNLGSLFFRKIRCMVIPFMAEPCLLGKNLLDHLQNSSVKV